jgi:hypothetical protein
MNKAVELFRRHPFRAVALLGFATLAVFFLLNTVGFLGSSWDACEDARMRRGSAQTDTMFKSAQADVKKFCEPDEAWATPSQSQDKSVPSTGQTKTNGAPRFSKDMEKLRQEIFNSATPTPEPVGVR